MDGSGGMGRSDLKESCVHKPNSTSNSVHRPTKVILLRRTKTVFGPVPLPYIPSVQRDDCP